MTTLHVAEKQALHRLLALIGSADNLRYKLSETKAFPCRFDANSITLVILNLIRLIDQSRCNDFALSLRRFIKRSIPAIFTASYLLLQIFKLIHYGSVILVRFLQLLEHNHHFIHELLF